MGYGINNAGQITGEASTASGFLHAFLYSNGVITDLGALDGGYVSGGSGINDAGQITGSSGHALLYSNGVITDLGTLPGTVLSYGLGINNAGQITGASANNHPPLNYAFLYSNGVMTDLNSLIDPNLQITLTVAAGINDLGQIVANGNNGRAYLLTPVPEPGTWMLFGAGLLLVGALARSYGRVNRAR